MILEVQNLVKKYSDKTVVNNVNLNVKEGEIFGLLGPNGAGKSTTINIIVGLLKFSSGKVTILGKDISKKNNKIKQEIGYVPQDLAFFEELTAIDNVMYWAKLYGLHGTELRAAVKEALEFTGLWDRRKDVAKSYSGGMKRRLNIACAIVHKPKLLFMDEPTVGVDPQSRNNIMESIKELNRMGTTVIYTSHYMEEIEALCQRVAIMDFGKVIALGTIDELVQSVSKESLIKINSNNISEDKINMLQALDGIKFNVNENTISITSIDNTMGLNSLVDAVMKCGIEMSSINVEKLNLETVFLSLTGKKLRD